MRTLLANLSRNTRSLAGRFVRLREIVSARFRRPLRFQSWKRNSRIRTSARHRQSNQRRLQVFRAGTLVVLTAAAVGFALWVRTGSTPAPRSQAAAAAVEASADPPAPAPRSQPAVARNIRRSDPDLARKIDALLDSRRYRRASWGVDVRYVDGGGVLYSRNPLKYFIPASNVKVFTTAAVLDRLGPNFRFETRLGYEGQLREDGILAGDLVLIGGGDPGLANNLGSRPIFQHLDNMAREVEGAGIRLIQGDVVGDDSFFSYAPHGRGWNKKDLEYHYAPRVSALSFHDNLLNLVARPGRRTGQPIRIASYPSNSLFQLVNMGTTVADGPQATGYFYRSLGNHKAVIGGQIPVNSPGWTRRITMEDPALYTATLLRDRLRKRGIRVEGSVRSRHATPSDGVDTQLIYVHESPPLIDIIFRVNRESHNLYAEILLRTLGAVVKGEVNHRTGRTKTEEAVTGGQLVLNRFGEGGFHLQNPGAANRQNERNTSLPASRLGDHLIRPAHLQGDPLGSAQRDGVLVIGNGLDQVGPFFAGRQGARHRGQVHAVGKPDRIAGGEGRLGEDSLFIGLLFDLHRRGRLVFFRGRFGNRRIRLQVGRSRCRIRPFRLRRCFGNRLGRHLFV